MPASKQFSQFIALMELIELLAARQTTESLSLRSPSGEPVGRLTVEGGQVRFGVEHRGRVLVDEVFMREQPRLSVILRKILDRHSLARTERDLTWDISAIGRVSLCELTARALRKVAADCILPPVPLRPPDTGLPQLRLLNVAFSPLELALAAGLWGNIRHEDLAVQLYFSPAVATQERWLFEWQPNDPGFAWPILTDQLGVRRVSDVRLFGTLGHLLMPSSSTRRLRSDRAATSAALVLFDEGICFVASSSRYMSLLVYDRTHIARVLTAYEEFIESDSSRRPDSGGSLLLAGKVALAAGQHAATTVSGLRLATPGYAATPSSVSSGPGAAPPQVPGSEGSRRSSIAPRAPAAPGAQAAPPAAAAASASAAPAGPTGSQVVRPGASPVSTVIRPSVPAAAAPPSMVSTGPTVAVGGAQAGQSASADTPVAASSQNSAASSAATPPVPAGGWPAGSGTAPAPSAVTFASSSTSAILALASVGLGGSGARGSEETPPAQPAQRPPVAVASASGPATSTAAAAAGSPKPSAPARENNGDDWVLAATELIDSTTWHAPSASTADPGPGPSAGSPAVASVSTSKPASPQPSVVEPATVVKPASVEPPRELLTSALLAAAMELGEDTPRPAARTSPQGAASEISPTSASVPAGHVAGGAAAAIPDDRTVGLGEWTPAPGGAAGAGVVVPRTLPPSAITPPAESTDAAQGIGGAAPPLALPAPAPGLPPIAPAAPAAAAVVDAAAEAASSTAQNSAGSLGTPGGEPPAASGAAGTASGSQDSDRDAILPSLLSDAGLPVEEATALASDPTVAGVVQLGFPDLALLAALPALESERPAGAAPATSLAASFALLPDADSAPAPAVDAAEPLPPAAAAKVSDEVSSAETPRPTRLPPPSNTSSAGRLLAEDLDGHELQFSVEEWTPVRALGRRDLPPEAWPQPPTRVAQELDDNPPDDSVHGAYEAGESEEIRVFDPELSQVAAQPAGEVSHAAQDESVEDQLDRLLDLQLQEATSPASESADVVVEEAAPSGLPSAPADPSEAVDSVAAPDGQDLSSAEAEAAQTAEALDASLAALAAPQDPIAAEAVDPAGEAQPVSHTKAGDETALPNVHDEATALEPSHEAEPLPPSALAVTLGREHPEEPVDASAPILMLDRFTARVDERTVLKDLTFSLERRGVCAIMGPGGSGKSSLLGILGGQNRQSGGWTFSGLCQYNGQPLGAGARPLTIPQTLHRTTLSTFDYLRSEAPEPQSVTEAQVQAILQRVRLDRLCSELTLEVGRLQPALGDGECWRLVIARALMRNPPLLCIDEPTAGLSDVEAALIIDVLKAEGLRRAVVFVTHNQQHARVISHRMMLLAGGRLQETETTEVFFSGPKSRAGQDYVRTGGCYVPSPDSPTEHLSEEFQAGPVLPPIAPPEPASEASQGVAAVPAPAPVVLSESEVLWADEASGKPPALSLRHFGLRVGARAVLQDLSLDVAARGLFVLGVPDGMAKRMLVRALCGPRPSNFQMEGQARYGRDELSDDRSPMTPQAGAQLLMMSVAGYLGSALAERSLSRPEQRAETLRLIGEAGFPELLGRLDTEMTSVEPAERRVLEILRVATALPAVMVLDEPLATLPPGQRERVIVVLQQQAKQRAVLILSQDTSVAADLGAQQGWIRDGRSTTQAPPPPEPPPEPVAQPAPVIEVVPVAPTGEPAVVPPAVVEPAAPAAAIPARRFSGRGPRGFQWLRLGALAGMPAPGMTNDLAYDLDLIRSTGVSWLVTLTHEPLPAAEVALHDLRNIQFPIVDMDVPTEEAAARLCGQVAELVAGGQAVGFHCKAGLGRTGTMLACQLIWEGTSAAAALKEVRSVEPGWIQSEKQVAFLGRFEEWLGQMWPMEGGQRKKRKPVPDVHQSMNLGAQLTEKKENSNDST